MGLDGASVAAAARYGDEFLPAMESSLTLRPSDIEMFRSLGVGIDLLRAAGVRRVTDAQARTEFGISGSPTQDMAGIVFPYFAVETGKRSTARLRRDNPQIEDNKPKNKYIAAFGDRRHLYFPPGANEKLDDPATAIVLCEAEKSSLAITAWAERIGRKVLAIATGGCWGWRGRIGRTTNGNGVRVDRTGPLPDLQYCSGRVVSVLLDTNIQTNTKVQAAERHLIAVLKDYRCDVRVCRLPEPGEESEGWNGPDDYIAVAGDEAFAIALDSPAKTEGPDDDLSEDALALIFTGRHSLNLRYVAPWGRWYRWSGAYWAEDSTLEVYDLARVTCREQAQRCPSTAMARLITSARTRAAIENLARSDRRHVATVDQWDKDEWLLNTPGGTIDLRTGELREAQHEDYITRSTTVAPDKHCATPVWNAFLRRITNNDDALIAYLQRVAGYSLTGSTCEHSMFFFYGTGRNGKGTFVNTLTGILGDGYARTAPVEAFVESQSDRHPTELAMLRGARLVTAVETEEGRHWAESKLKALTGGDKIAARFMRQDFFEYTPTFKLIVQGNHKPSLRSVDEAIRARIKIIPFVVTIPPDQRDLNLADKLVAEWPGILAWMITGCTLYLRDGLTPPASVAEATNEYFAAEDTMTQWIEEKLRPATGVFTRTDVLFSNWQSFAMTAGETVGRGKAFNAALTARFRTKGWKVKVGRNDHMESRPSGFFGVTTKGDA